MTANPASERPQTHVFDVLLYSFKFLCINFDFSILTAKFGYIMMSLKRRHLRIIELTGKTVVNREIQGKDLEGSGRTVFEDTVLAFYRKTEKEYKTLTHDNN